MWTGWRGRTWRSTAPSALAAASLLAALTGLEPAVTPQVSEGAAAIVEADLLRIASGLEGEVSAIRGLPVRHPIKKGVKSREEIHRFLSARLDEMYPGEKLDAETKVLVRLGLVAPGTDIRAVLEGLLVEQVAGYYDEHRHELFVADWVPADQQRGTLVHELTHALQDQHYDLAMLLAPTPRQDDALLARQALVEGEGMAVMMEDQLRPYGQTFSSVVAHLPEISRMAKDVLEQSRAMTGGDGGAFAAAPRYLQQMLLFPYLSGLEFVAACRQKLDWSGMDRVYRDPPASTEQVLHPAKYLEERDPPVPLSFADVQPALGQGWREITQGTAGEFALSLVVGQYVPQAMARVAADGWGGDFLRAYERADDGAVCVALLTAWDSEADAREFFEAWWQRTQRRYPGAKPISTEQPTRVLLKNGGEEIYLELEAQRVAVVEGAPPGLAPKLRKLLLGG